MDGDRLYVPKVGWLRLAGSDLYAGCRPLTVRVWMEGTEQHPQWYADVCYAVPAVQVKQPAADGALGLDRNVEQATDSEGTMYAMPDTDKLDAQIARKQRELIRKQGWGPKDRRTPDRADDATGGRARSRCTGTGGNTGGRPGAAALRHRPCGERTLRAAGRQRQSTLWRGRPRMGRRRPGHRP